MSDGFREYDRAVRYLVALLVFAGVLAGCGPWGSTCESKCYGQKTNEPRDFDDCVRRCQK